MPRSQILRLSQFVLETRYWFVLLLTCALNSLQLLHAHILTCTLSWYNLLGKLLSWCFFVWGREANAHSQIRDFFQLLQLALYLGVATRAKIDTVWRPRSILLFAARLQLKLGHIRMWFVLWVVIGHVILHWLPPLVEQLSVHDDSLNNQKYIFIPIKWLIIY